MDGSGRGIPRFEDMSCAMLHAIVLAMDGPAPDLVGFGARRGAGEEIPGCMKANILRA